MIGRIELNLSRSERIASSIQVVSSTTSTAFARLEEVQGAARQFIGDQQSREAQREIDLVTNAPTVLERTEEASGGLAESKDPTPAMKLSLAPLPDGERETAETRGTVSTSYMVEEARSRRRAPTATTAVPRLLRVVSVTSTASQKPAVSSGSACRRQPMRCVSAESGSPIG